MSRRPVIASLALLIALSATGGVWAAQATDPAAEAAYQKARTAYYEFKADAARLKLRHHWHNTARRFEQVAERFPRSERTPDALFTAGRLYYELFAISRVTADLDRAEELFRRLVEGYPDSRLADDAQMYRALQYVEFRKDPKAAAGELVALLARFPQGDVTPRARRMLEDLGGPPAEDAEAKPPEAKPPETKPPDVKPPEARPPEAKPPEVKPPEVKPPEAKLAVAERPLLEQIRHDSGPDYTRIALVTGGRIEYRVGVLPAEGDNPARLYLDLFDIGIDPGLKGPIEVRDSVVSRIRFAPHRPGVVRVVVDLVGQAEHKVFPMDNPARVVVDVSSASPQDRVASIIGQKLAQPDAGTPEPTGSADGGPVDAGTDTGIDAFDAVSVDAGAPEDGGELAEADAAVPEPVKPVRPRIKKSDSRPGKSLSMLAGLKVRRVVIDPGHGGRDPGAIGPSGTLEKDLALDIGKRLAKLLRADADLGLKEVVLTRSDDRYLELEKRTAIANKKDADLFISVHCNAHPNRRFRGVETFYLDLTDDRYSIKLAARENSTSEKTISDLRFILADLALKSHVDDSIRLGEFIQRATVGKLRRKYKGVHDLKLKPALFYVLIGARMPSVLVETSFISHPEEEKRLKTKVYRQELATGIYTGIKNFISERDRELDPDI